MSFRTCCGISGLLHTRGYDPPKTPQKILCTPLEYINNITTHFSLKIYLLVQNILEDFGMKKIKKRLRIRFRNEVLHRKLQHIAKYKGRSLSSLLLYYVMRDIEQFEKENGKIEGDSAPNAE